MKMYNLGYRGGSGGFIFLHFLLLSDKYQTCFHSDHDFKSIIKTQWNISNLSNWKSTEVRPNNNATISDDNKGKDKLLFFCNPSPDEFFNFAPFANLKKNYCKAKYSTWPNIDSFSDFLKLPIQIQQEVVDIHSVEFTPFVNFKKNYCNVKDLIWPNIDSFSDFLKLPIQIQQEVVDIHSVEFTPFVNFKKNYRIVNCPAVHIWLYTDISSQNELAWCKKAYNYFNNSSKEKITNLDDYATLWKDTLVDTEAVYFLENSNIQIKLQHWINEPDILVDHRLIDKINQKQYNLLNTWKKLHPPELLQKIGIK